MRIGVIIYNRSVDNQWFGYLKNGNENRKVAVTETPTSPHNSLFIYGEK